MKVRATDRGTYPGSRLREVGEEFDYERPKGAKADYLPSWMEAVEGKQEDKQPDKGRQASKGAE